MLLPGRPDAQSRGFRCCGTPRCSWYLLNHFLSPFSNQRDDPIRGSDENRMRFVLEIMQRHARLWVRISRSGFAYRQMNWCVADILAFMQKFAPRWSAGLMPSTVRWVYSTPAIWPLPPWIPIRFNLFRARPEIRSECAVIGGRINNPIWLIRPLPAVMLI